MSLSPQSTASIESPWSADEKTLVYECPTCGEETLRWVTEDVTLQDGKIAALLEHLACSSCGEKCFDVAAMKRIEGIRGKQPRRRSTIHVTASVKHA